MKLLTEIWNSSPQNICDVFVKAVIEIIVTIGSLKLLLTYTRPVLNGETLTLSWRRPLSYRNQSIDLIRKSMDWFLYDNGLRHERVKVQLGQFLALADSQIHILLLERKSNLK